MGDSSPENFQLESLVQAGRKYAEGLLALEPRILQELASYQTELAQLRHERDAAVEARLSAKRALQRATQNHSLDRNTYEHETHIMNEKDSELHEATAARALQDFDLARKDAEHWRTIALAQTERSTKVPEELTHLKQTLSSFTKWTYDLAVAEGRAAFSDDEDPASHPPAVLAQNPSPVSPPPPPARALSPLPRSAASRLRGMPALKPRTRSATYEDEAEAESSSMAAARHITPAKHKQQTLRTTHEPATPRSAVAAAEDDWSEDELAMPRSGPSPRKRTIVLVRHKLNAVASSSGAWRLSASGRERRGATTTMTTTTTIRSTTMTTKTTTIGRDGRPRRLSFAPRRVSVSKMLQPCVSIVFVMPAGFPCFARICSFDRACMLPT